jgi:putative transposase
MKARISHAALETNPGKLRQLDELQAAYMIYTRSCVDQLVRDRRPFLLLSERHSYFPTSDILSSQILKASQNQAVSLVHTWVKSLYARKLKGFSSKAPVTDLEKIQLRCIGKYSITKAGKFGKGVITQEMIDLYWSWIFDPTISGNPPAVRDNLPMVMTECTCSFGPSDLAGSTHFGWWLRFSGLTKGRRIQIPLASNPYLKTIDGLAKTVFVRKVDGRWTFQFTDRTEDPEFEASTGKLGIDVGLNVLAADSNGRLYGEDFKPRFDSLYGKVRDLRSNRQRQDLKRDSKRLHRLENKLSGMIKTATGTIANQITKSHPRTTFVIEDLDLRGCKGQKRFAYRALHNSLSHKARAETVNPAYTSQMCPSCGHIDKKNRSGTKFNCRSCGRLSHADVIGAINLLGRSEDKEIGRNDHPSVVRATLRMRSQRKRWVSTSKPLKIKTSLNGQAGDLL